MTIAEVSANRGGTNANNTTSISRAFSQNVATGSLVIVVGMRFSGSQDAYLAADCTKSAGTATLGTIQLDRVQSIDLGTTNDEWVSIGIFSAIVTSGGSLTMQLGGAPSGSYHLIGMDEFTGNWDSSRAESGNVGGTESDGQTSASSGNATSAGAALFVGGLNVNSNVGVSITPDGAFTTIFEDESGANNLGSAIFRLVSSGTTDAAEWTIGNPNFGWAAALQIYKEAAGGGSGSLITRDRNMNGGMRDMCGGMGG
ncbi:hypothetical protein [Povalibacter sp.]|uniref:hypothetical protein n=1 Tax=Povalibacter sp. TaxID=1962978 RepID=UPI002F41E1C4